MNNTYLFSEFNLKELQDTFKKQSNTIYGLDITDNDLEKIVNNLIRWDVRSDNSTIFDRNKPITDYNEKFATVIADEYFGYLNVLKLYDYQTKYDELLNNITEIEATADATSDGKNYENNNIKEDNSDKWKSDQFINNSSKNNSNVKTTSTKTNKDNLIKYQKELQSLNMIAGTCYQNMLTYIYKRLTLPFSNDTGEIKLPWPFTYD